MVFSSCPLMRQMLLSVSRAAAAGEAKTGRRRGDGSTECGTAEWLMFEAVVAEYG